MKTKNNIMVVSRRGVNQVQIWIGENKWNITSHERNINESDIRMIQNEWKWSEYLNDCTKRLNSLKNFAYNQGYSFTAI